VKGTLRGVFDVEIEENEDGVSFAASDGAADVAQLFRHPPTGARVVYLTKPTLWDVYARLKAEGTRG
jgi:hypothetical protein